MKSIYASLPLLACVSMVESFVVRPFHFSGPLPSSSRRGRGALFMEDKSRPDFSFSFEIPKKGISDIGTAEVNLPPLLENSEVVVVRYDLPFGLNAGPDAASGQIVVKADGAGGERVGDILRQTTYWRGRDPGIFDVSKNAGNFDLVVQALKTNDLSVADEIVLVFERPL